jgi:hypothetical protein
MKQRTLQHLYGYWNEVRAGRLAPLRLEIEPSRIAGILSETFMLERHDVQSYQYRLAGTRLCELFGSELRGSSFLQGWSDADRAVLQRHLAAVCDQGAVVVLTIEGSADTRHRMELEVILLPLLHGGNRISRVIGAMSASTAPHWLYDHALQSRRLLRHETIWPDGRPHAAVERSGRAPFLPTISPKSISKVGPKTTPRMPPRVVDGRIVKTDRRQFRVLEGGRSGDKYDKR